ncbi:Molybdenum transport system permease protein ModB [Clostridiaceae bacterium JG1575]|nr:Molybdenum transport system permease protein ModB [Clostridiaceae bacterium JG1575]
MDTSPILISLKTATLAILITFFGGLFMAYWVGRVKHPKLRFFLDLLLTLPMVLPPTVAGFFLLYSFGDFRFLGKILIALFGSGITFTFGATVLAATVISFPLMYRSARAAFLQVPRDIEDAARTLGASEFRIFYRVTLPNAWPGITSGVVLAFTRGLGEFGATAMIAGNIQGKTRTLPLAIYSEVAAGKEPEAMQYVLILLSVAILALFILGLVDQKGGRA